jgi:hypothetical protein
MVPASVRGDERRGVSLREHQSQLDDSVRFRNKRTSERPGRTGPWKTHARGETVVVDFRFADYFERKVLRKRPYLKKEWCIAVVEKPTRWERQGDLRCRFWAPIPELGGRYLRVVTLADKVTILNAFPDRGFKP